MTLSNAELRALIEERSTDLRAARLPIFSIDKRELCGFEMLIRGIDLAPQELFVRSAELGLLKEADLVCLAKSLEAAEDIADGMRVHLNLFPQTLLEIDPDWLVDALNSSKRGRIYCIELIEHRRMPHPEEFFKGVKTLRNAGIEIAIDDVGYGHSALESLIHLEPEVIKIDKSLVTNAFSSSERSRRLTRLAGVCKSLGARIVAEGIDSEGDCALALELSMDMGQGLIGGPIP